MLNRSVACKTMLRLTFLSFLVVLFCCPGMARLFMNNTLGDLNFDYQAAVPSDDFTKDEARLYNGLLPVLAPIPRGTCGSEWTLSFVHRVMRYNLGLLMLLGLLSWAPTSPLLAKYGQHTMYPYLLHPWIFQLIVLPMIQRHMPLLVESLYKFSLGGYVWGYAVLIAPVLTLALSSRPVRLLTRVLIEPTWMGSILFSSEVADALEHSKSESQGKRNGAPKDDVTISKVDV